MLYDAAGQDRNVEITRPLVAQLSKTQLLWIDIENADNDVTSELVAALDIPPSTIRRVTDLTRPPYLDNYDSCFAFAVDAPGCEAGDTPENGKAGVQLGFIVAGQ
ncbi:MAG: hypothetical protein H7267_00205 [Sandarakinorhabdus sp.]|nr:hypothetical protein [Sandarakinorhabdus sp.]